MLWEIDMEHRQPTAESIVKSAHQGEFAVPEFQRGFVWTVAQVRELADSLTHNYPVGSILTWKSSTAIQRGDGDQRRQNRGLSTASSEPRPFAPCSTNALTGGTTPAAALGLNT